MFLLNVNRKNVSYTLYTIASKCVLSFYSQLQFCVFNIGLFLELIILRQYVPIQDIHFLNYIQITQKE